MQYYPVTGSCYQLGQDRFTQTEAESYCNAIHPEAHLIDVETTAEFNIAFELSVSMGLGNMQFLCNLQSREQLR